jgi:dihydroorotase
MIDPHVHLRDWRQSHKETLSHGLSIAIRAGLDGLFEMPNTEPSLTSAEAVRLRIAAVDSLKMDIFHGLYLGLTENPAQAKEMVKIYHELFPRTVGMKLYAGGARGDLAVTGREGQKKVFETLAGEGYRGVVAVHCEDEGLLREDLWNCKDPRSHCRARPPESEVASVRHVIDCAMRSSFRGRLHLCHISVPEAVSLVRDRKNTADFSLTCAITPHHALLSDEMVIDGRGLLLKVNPPLRPRPMQEAMLALLLEGQIDFIESDHAPHRLSEKTDCRDAETPPSGLPVLPFLPRFLEILREKGMSAERLDELTVSNIEKAFGITAGRKGRRAEMNLQSEYDFDPFEGFR